MHATGPLTCDEPIHDDEYNIPPTSSSSSSVTPSAPPLSSLPLPSAFPASSSSSAYPPSFMSPAPSAPPAYEDVIRGSLSLSISLYLSIYLSCDIGGRTSVLAHALFLRGGVKAVPLCSLTERGGNFCDILMT